MHTDQKQTPRRFSEGKQISFLVRVWLLVKLKSRFKSLIVQIIFCWVTLTVKLNFSDMCDLEGLHGLEFVVVLKPTRIYAEPDPSKLGLYK